MLLKAFILFVEALGFYFLVLVAHSLRLKFGPAPFYALLGGLTAIMSWVTDAGLRVELAGITFVIGSNVFYKAILLGVFVVYVFDGPHSTRVAISTVVVVSVIMPLIAAMLHFQAGFSGFPLVKIPLPDLRINTASVLTTIVDMFFLAIVWEYIGKKKLRMSLWLRTYSTLLGVMWLDVLLFATGAFAGKPYYFSIMSGTFLSRLIISLIAFPILYIYSGKTGFMVRLLKTGQFWQLSKILPGLMKIYL